MLQLIRHHHERYDGRGYPDQLAGEDIPRSARILCIADVYDALTSVRSYKRAMSHDEAMAILFSTPFLIAIAIDAFVVRRTRHAQ